MQSSKSLSLENYFFANQWRRRFRAAAPIAKADDKSPKLIRQSKKVTNHNLVSGTQASNTLPQPLKKPKHRVDALAFIWSSLPVNLFGYSRCFGRLVLPIANRVVEKNPAQPVLHDL